jgi:hypothetical protein
LDIVWLLRFLFFLLQPMLVPSFNCFEVLPLSNSYLKFCDATPIFVRLDGITSVPFSFSSASWA